MVRAGTAPARYAPELSQPRHYRPLTRRPRSRRSSPSRVRLLVSVRGEDTQHRSPGRRHTETNSHTFRATGITAYLLNGGALERAQRIAAHESPRTTKLYDRTADEVTVEDIEKIGI